MYVENFRRHSTQTSHPSRATTSTLETNLSPLQGHRLPISLNSTRSLLLATSGAVALLPSTRPLVPQYLQTLSVPCLLLALTAGWLLQARRTSGKPKLRHLKIERNSNLSPTVSSRAILATLSFSTPHTENLVPSPGYTAERQAPTRQTQSTTAQAP